MRVVIAEDAALLREGLTRLLEDRGHSICVAVSDGDALLAAVLEQPGQPLPQERGILGDHDPHQWLPQAPYGLQARSGNSTVTVVGPPAGLTTSIRPSTVETRCASPVSPLPRAASAPPTPSSLTSRRRTPLRSV